MNLTLKVYGKKRMLNILPSNNNSVPLNTFFYAVKILSTLHKTNSKCPNYSSSTSFFHDVHVGMYLKDLTHSTSHHVNGTWLIINGYVRTLACFGTKSFWHHKPHKIRYYVLKLLSSKNLYLSSIQWSFIWGLFWISCQQLLL